MKRTPMTHFRPADDGAPRQQHGALCWRHRDDRIEILLVTSRETGRWVIPKGWPVDGLDPAAAAAREAWEEAGVRGRVMPQPLGVFAYDKVLDRESRSETAVACVVTVHAIEVTAMDDRFPEAGQRRLRWFSRSKAARKVDEADLRALIEGFAPAPG